MRARRKSILIVMVIILVCQLLGENKVATEIKAAGKFLIPTATRPKPYDAVITITRAEIGIECALKIFQPFNQFDAPKQEKIIFNTAEVERITIQENGFVIFPKTPLYYRYRNLLHRIRVGVMLGHQRMVFVFVIDMDIYKNIGSNEKDLIDSINKRNDPKCRLCGFIGFY